MQLKKIYRGVMRYKNEAGPAGLYAAESICSRNHSRNPVFRSALDTARHSTLRSSSALTAFAAVFMSAALVHPAYSATFTVTNSNDSGDGSLRQAITDAAGVPAPHTITFDPGLFGGDIILQSPLPALDFDVTIDGSNAAGVTISGDDQVRIFHVGNGNDPVSVTLRDLTIRNGSAEGGDGGSSGGGGGGGGGAGMGGGIFVDSNAELVLDAVDLADNEARGGSGGSAGTGDPYAGGGGGGLNGEDGQTPAGDDGGAGGGSGGAGGNDGFGGTGGGGQAGGFGGGGGGGGFGTGARGPGGAGGFGGGDGGRGGQAGISSNQAGNGGSGFGGAIFVREGGSIRVIDGAVSGNTTSAGSGRLAGAAAGSGFFLMDSDLIYEVSNGQTATIADTIAGTSGAGLVKEGDGTLVLTGNNSHGGGNTINAGILSIGHDNALGTGAGTVADGAALRLEGNISVGAPLSLAGTGPASGGALQNHSGTNSYSGDITLTDDASIVSHAGTLTISGDIGGSGDPRDLTLGGAGNGLVSGFIGNGIRNLSMDGSGTWALTGGANLNGSVDVADGTLIADQGAHITSGAVNVSGSADIPRLIVRDGAVWSATGATLTIAEHAGTLGILDIGASEGEPAAAPGKIHADTVHFGSGTGVLNFNHTGTHYTFDPAISGSGRINFAGGTTILTADSSSFTGTTTFTGGALRVDGTLGGSVEIGSGSVLGGGGTIGATTVGAGGTIAPGNSIGTLNVDGDLTFEAGSVYRVDVDPGGTSSDLIQVDGTAHLAGTVRHVGLPGQYRPFSEYTILSATGGLVGTFDGASSDYYFLSALLSYGAHDVTLRLMRNDTTLDSVARTPNQKAVADGIDSLDPSNTLQIAVVTQGASGARQAFDQLSGEVHASGIAALHGNGGRLRSIISRRFQSASDERRAMTRFPLTSYASLEGFDGPGEVSDDRDSRYGVWGEAFGAWGRTRGDGNSAGLRHDDGGFLAGADVALNETTSLGIFTGYSRTTFSARDRASSGTSDNLYLGVQAGTQLGALRLNIGATHSWHDVETQRSVAFLGYVDNLSASYRGRTAQAFGEAGYRFGTKALSFEPFAGLAHVHTTTDRFTETGGAASLTSARTNMETTFSTLGLRAFSEFELAGMPATVRGMIGWRHASGDVTPTTRLNFAGGAGFQVSGAPIARNTALVEAGLDLGVSDLATFNVSYDGEFSRDTQHHGFNARLRVSF